MMDWRAEMLSRTDARVHRETSHGTLRALVPSAAMTRVNGAVNLRASNSVV